VSQLNVIVEKITKIFTLDKKVWNNLDDQEQKCSDVLREIETIRDEMVSLSFYCLSHIIAWFRSHHNLHGIIYNIKLVSIEIA